jgi:hypothetical protein
MLYNKYQYIDDPRLLTRPQRAIVPSGSSLTSFDSKSPTLDQDCNFALEMLKFLPKTEVLGYAGQKTAVAGSPGAVDIQHGHYDANGNGNANGSPENDWVTKDYYDAFNEYSLPPSDATLTMAEIEGMTEPDKSDSNYDADEAKYQKFKAEVVHDCNGDGRITNSDVLQICEELDPSVDAFQDWYTILAAGKHHRSGPFGSFGNDTEGGVAGDGMLAGFSNIDAVKSSTADDWNHIKGSVGNYDMAYNPTVQAALAANGLSWGDVENMLSQQFSGMSYYEIVMDPNKKYQTLSPKDSLLLTCAMDESRYRAWKAMTDLFGSVSDTRSDQAMIADINKAVKGLNSYNDHHSISLIPFFLYIQHSFTNQATNYYEKGLGEHDGTTYKIGDSEGYNKSYLDTVNFSAFSQWLGSLNYNADKGCDHLDKSYAGQLFEQRGTWTDDDEAALNNSSGSQRAALQARKDKVLATNALIDEWYGATDPVKANKNIDGIDKLSEPVWEGYQDVWESDDWRSIAPLRLDNGKTIVEVNFSQLKGVSYGWDRKASNYPIECKDASGEIWWTSWASDANWITVQNAISSSKVNTKNNDAHENYDTAQFQGLTADGTTTGPLFNGNWVVHAIGMYYRAGSGLDLMQTMNKSMMRRQVTADYKKDVTNYTDRKDELAEEQAEDEKIAQLAQAKAKAERKKWLERGKKPAAGKATSNNNASQSAAAAAAQKQAFNKSLQGLAQKLYDGGAKRKAQLKKNQG